MRVPTLLVAVLAVSTSYLEFAEAQVVNFTYVGAGRCTDANDQEYSFLAHSDYFVGSTLDECKSHVSALALSGTSLWANGPVIGLDWVEFLTRRRTDGSVGPLTVTKLACFALYDAATFNESIDVPSSDWEATFQNPGTGPIVGSNEVDLGECHVLSVSTSAPTTTQTSSPSANPSTAPTSSPTAAPTGCVDSKIFVAIDRTYSRNVRANLEFGIDVLTEAIELLQEETGFECMQMVFASLLHDQYIWMVEPENEDSRVGDALADSSRMREKGNDWLSGYHFRSVALNFIFEDGTLAEFCGEGSGDTCFLVVLTDGKFRTRKGQQRNLQAYREARDTIMDEYGMELHVTCIFPRRSLANRRSLNSVCDVKKSPVNGGANIGSVAAEFVDRVLESR